MKHVITRPKTLNSTNKWTIASIIGVGGLMTSLGVLYYEKTSSEQIYIKNIDLSKKQVKKAFNREFPKPIYTIPRFDRKELYLDVLDRSNRKILLIESPSGTGKTKLRLQMNWSTNFLVREQEIIKA
jgi:hypothetical protein